MTPEVLAALESDGTIDITTTGARSGLPRRSEIWFLQLAGRTFITGTSDPRNWYANVLAEPRFVFHLKETLSAGPSSPCDPCDRRAHASLGLHPAASVEPLVPRA